ncbi:hypothetical protein ACIBFB_10785 [Nocardiopsis sp. NPDC050513]
MQEPSNRQAPHDPWRDLRERLSAEACPPDTGAEIYAGDLCWRDL